ncbi:MAG: hypothetical protein ACRDB0_07060 [Paraclostridium sp.]
MNEYNFEYLTKDEKYVKDTFKKKCNRTKCKDCFLREIAVINKDTCLDVFKLALKHDEGKLFYYNFSRKEFDKFMKRMNDKYEEVRNSVY